MLTDPADLIGANLGESETKTRAVLKKAIGNVLVIDEAYALGGKTEYHKGIQNTLVAGIPSSGGANMAVILAGAGRITRGGTPDCGPMSCCRSHKSLALHGIPMRAAAARHPHTHCPPSGYEEETLEMLREGNPGLSRRFSSRFIFENYSHVQLRMILKDKAAEAGARLTFPVAEAAAKLLSAESKLRTFGNAGAAEALLEKLQAAAVAEHLRRILHDLPAPTEKPIAAAMQLADATDAAFVLGPVGLGYDRSSDRVLVQLEEVIEFDEEGEPIVDEDDDDRSKLRVFITRHQAHAFCLHADQVVAAGRPSCIWCARPIDPDGHSCPRMN